MKRAYEPQNNEAGIKYHVPPRGMFNHPKYDFQGQVEILYAYMGYKQIAIQKYLLQHIEQDIDGEKFSPQQIEWFWEASRIHLNMLYKKILITKTFTTEEKDTFHNILNSILNCKNEDLVTKAQEYCKEQGVEIRVSEVKAEPENNQDDDSINKAIEVKPEEIEAAGSNSSYDESSIEAAGSNSSYDESSSD